MSFHGAMRNTYHTELFFPTKFNAGKKYGGADGPRSRDLTRDRRAL